MQGNKVIASLAINAVLALAIFGFIAYHTAHGNGLQTGLRASRVGSFSRVAMMQQRPSFRAGAKTMREPVSEEYGTGLASMAIEEKLVDKIQADMTAWQDVFKASPEVKEFMYDPLADVTEKKAIVDDVVSKSGMHEYTSNFLTLLLEMGRFDQFDSIAEVFDEEIMALQGTKSVVVRSAVELDEPALQKIASRVKEISGSKKVAIKQQIDESLLAGFVIDLEGSVIDMSLKNELSELKAEMLKPAAL